VLTNLDPGATYEYQVESTDPAGNGPAQSAVAQFATLAVPAALAISADKSSPRHIGTIGTVTFTARAGAGIGRYEYQFWLKAKKSGKYALKQDYGPSSRWAWTPDPLDPNAVDYYEVQVRARIAGTTAPYEQYAIRGYYVVAEPLVTAVTLRVDRHSPQRAGTTLSVTAEVVGSSDAHEYRFWLARGAGAYAPLTVGYVSDKTLLWTPTAAGVYKVAVWVRNARSIASFEKSAVLGDYHVLTYAPVSAVSLAASPKSPQAEGAAVSFTALATPGETGAAVEYRFWLYTAASGTWVAVGDATSGYSAARKWHWIAAAPGSYQVMVYARTIGDGAPYEALRKLSFTVN